MWNVFEREKCRSYWFFVLTCKATAFIKKTTAFKTSHYFPFPSTKKLTLLLTTHSPTCSMDFSLGASRIVHRVSLEQKFPCSPAFQIFSNVIAGAQLLLMMYTTLAFGERLKTAQMLLKEALESLTSVRQIFYWSIICTVLNTG